jgi:subtilisin family serine protease
MMSLQAAIDRVGLGPVKARTGGAGRRIGLVDGAVDWSAPGLAAARREVVAEESFCDRCRPTAHGTFVAALLVGSGGLCPEATLRSVPVFGADRTVSSSAAVAAAVAELLDAGVDVINISLGIAGGAIEPHPDYAAICARAERQGVPLVVAAGNQARVGPVPLARHPWVIPVAACLEDGRPHPMSNLGPSLGARGFSAPGWAFPGSGNLGGTSQAAGFVTAAIALLMSLDPRRSAAGARAALLATGRRGSSVVPPLLDVEAAWRRLAA